MQKQLLNLLKYTFGIGLAVVLIYLAYKDQDWTETWLTLKDSNFWWLIPAAFFGFLSHYLRGARWAMLIKAAGYQTTASNAFWATGVGYLVNNVVPRLGELTRCTMLVRSDSVPFFASAGTVVTERMIDMLTFAALLLLMMLFEFDAIVNYFAQASSGDDQSGGMIWVYLGILALLGLLGLVAIYIFREKLLNTSIGKKVWEIIKTVFSAMLSIRKLERTWLFLVYTVSIWLCYILFAWVWLQGFSSDHSFGFYESFVLVSMGTIGMAIPTPGGIGPYHNVIKYTGVIIFGFTASTSATLAIFLHTPQYLTGIVAGIIGYLVLLAKRPSKAKGIDTEVDADGLGEPRQAS